MSVILPTTSYNMNIKWWSCGSVFEEEINGSQYKKT